MMHARFSTVLRFIGVALAGATPHAWPASLSPLWSQGGHASRVSAVAISADGTLFVTASDDFTVKIWKTNGTLVRTLNTEPSAATAMAISADGTKIAVGTYFGGTAQGNASRFGYNTIPGLGVVYLWQAPGGWASGGSLAWARTNLFGKVTSLSFSGDGSRVAWGNAAGSNYVYATSGGSLLATRAGYNTNTGPAAVSAVAFSPSSWLVSGCDDKTLRLWNASWNQVWASTSSHASNVTTVAFSRDGAAFVSASLDATLRLWSTNGTLTRTFTGHTNGVTAAALSPDGTKVASGSLDGTVKIWDRALGTCIATVAAHSGAVTSLAFTPDSARVLSGGADAAVRLWAATDGSAVQTFGGQQDYIGAVAISADGLLCASAGGGSPITVRRASDGTVVLRLAGHSNFVSALVFSPDSATLASGGGPLDPVIRLWSMRDGSQIRVIPTAGSGVTALAFSPDGTLLASGGDCTEQAISLWDPASGNLLLSLPGHTNGVTALAFSARGDLLASGGRRPDQAVKIWAVTNGSLVGSFYGHSDNIEAIAFRPDGGTVASGSSGPNNLKVWRLADGSCRNFGTGTNPVFAVGFSPTGSTLASADSDTVKFWNFSPGTLSETDTQETFRATCLAFSPNGNRVVIGREDATMVLFANLAGAMGQPPLAFTGVTASGGGLSLAASVQPGTHYVLQTSTNLADWTYLTQASSPNTSLSLSALPVTNASSAFIRAFTPP